MQGYIYSHLSPLFLLRRRVLRVKLVKLVKIIATPFPGVQGGASLVRADGLARIPLNCEGLEAVEAEVELKRYVMK